MINLLIFLLIVWVAISIIGAVVEGLIWLTGVGIVLFLATAAFLWIKRKATNSGQ